MISRVTSSAVNSTLASQINKRYADYAKLTNQITTGKRVNSLMDDTIESVNIINSNRQLTRIGVMSANVSSIANEIKDSSETIEKVIDKAQRAKDLATTAANGTSTKSTIKASLSELDQIIETVVNLANTNYNGNYLYGGTNTKTSAYSIEYGIDDKGNKTDEIIGIKYNGTPIDKDWQRQLEVADGVFQTMNVTGIEVFGDYDKEPIYEADGVTPVLDADGKPTYKLNSSSGVMSDLIELRNALQDTIDKLDAQEALPDNATQAEKEAAGADVKACYDNINGLLDGFSESMDKMTLVNSRFGTITNKMTMSTESLKDSENNLKEYVSGIQEIDLTQAVSDWYNAQYAYQASMQASTSIMSMNLLNYI